MAVAKSKIYLFSFFFIAFLLIRGSQAEAQLMNHYWSQGYNSISTLLSGAVVAGDAGNASIYYNPAGIVYIEEGNNISVAASIFTLSSYYFKNIMGSEKHISSTNLYVQPQFFSYGIKSPFNKWSFEIAVFNRIRENMTLNFVEGQDFNLKYKEQAVNRLSTVFNYENNYSDDWIGIGGGYKYSENLQFGMSINASFSTFKYSQGISATVFPLIADTVLGNPNTRILAENEYNESIGFTDVRLLAKFGAIYNKDKVSFGINISLPALKLFSVGKKASRSAKEAYSAIIDPNNQMNDYYIFDSQSASEIKTNFKLPFSIAFGSIFKLQNYKKIYLTVEYFAALSNYKMVDAKLNTDITTDVIYESLPDKDWLTYQYSNRAIVNLAVGYQWQIKTNVLLMLGLRTDFNSVDKHIVREGYSAPTIYYTPLNIYHATGGIKFTYKKHQLIAGTQFSFGRQNNVSQIASFDSENDFLGSNKRLPLLGVPENKATVTQLAISLFLGATLNFSNNKKSPND